MVLEQVQEGCGNTAQCITPPIGANLASRGTPLQAGYKIQINRHDGELARPRGASVMKPPCLPLSLPQARDHHFSRPRPTKGQNASTSGSLFREAQTCTAHIYRSLRGLYRGVRGTS